MQNYSWVQNTSAPERCFYCQTMTAYTTQYRCTWIMHHSFYCRHAEKKILSLFSLNAPAEIWEHISLFQIYQLYKRWSRDDPTPADWWHTMCFPGMTLRALLCNLGLLGVGTTSSTFSSGFHACAQEYSRIRKSWGANYLLRNYFQFLQEWAIKVCNAGKLMVLMGEDSSTVWRQLVFNCYILMSGFTQDDSCHIISILLPAVLLMVMVNPFLNMNWVTSFYFLLRRCYINLEIYSE